MNERSRRGQRAKVILILPAAFTMASESNERDRDVMNQFGYFFSYVFLRSLTQHITKFYVRCDVM